MSRHLILWTLAFLSINFVFANQRDTLEISFSSEGHNLKGKLLVPDSKQEKIPAIVFLVGSGGHSSYATDYKKFLEFFLEEPLQHEDVAFLYFDKRGVGASEGQWHKTDFDQRALDAKNAAAHLKSFPFIDTEKIFVVGHSQGGWIVQQCLAAYPEYFAGGVSMAGPTFDVKRQLVNDYQSKFICTDNYSEEKAHQKAKRRVKRDLTVVSLFPIQEDWKQLKVIKKYDPKPHLLNIQKPLLLMWAENDVLVYPEWCLEDLQELFPNGNPETITTYIASGENHSFQTSPFCFKGNRSELKYSKTSRDKMIDWLKTQLRD